MKRWAAIALVALLVLAAPGTSSGQSRGGHVSTGRAGPAGPQGPVIQRAWGPSGLRGRHVPPGMVFVPGPFGVRSPRFLFGPVVPFGHLGFGLFTPWSAIPFGYPYGPGVLAPPPVPLSDAPLGGVQLDVEPRRAQVYVDGQHAGIVDQFRGYYHHLDVPAGSHRIEIVEPGYLPLTIDVLVSPGHTTTYRGTLMRAPGY